MSTLYAGVTNAFARKSYTKTLTEIVAATKIADTTKNFSTLPADLVEKLVKADATLINVAASHDGGKNHHVQATAAGVAAVDAAEPLTVAVKRTVVAGQFAIETSIPVPAIKRGGDRAQMYPFDQLGLGQSFFVPATPEMEAPAKTLASAVSSATRRHKLSSPPRVFTIRGDEDEFPTAADKGRKGARVWRIEPAAATTDQASGDNSTAS